MVTKIILLNVVGALLGGYLLIVFPAGRKLVRILEKYEAIPPKFGKVLFYSMFINPFMWIHFSLSSVDKSAGDDVPF